MNRLLSTITHLLNSVFQLVGAQLVFVGLINYYDIKLSKKAETLVLGLTVCLQIESHCL